MQEVAGDYPTRGGLTPATEYIGPAWYQREVQFTRAECQQHIALLLARCGWLSAVWLNGVALGQQDSLVAPHEYNLSPAVQPGALTWHQEVALQGPVHLWDEFTPEFHSNWQWWDVLRPFRVLNLDGLQPRPNPIVRMVDAFIFNRCLGVLFEARLGQGRLLVTSLDLSSDLMTRNAARQLRQSLESYVRSAAFQPTVELRSQDVDQLIAAHQQPPLYRRRTAGPNLRRMHTEGLPLLLDGS